MCAGQVWPLRLAMEHRLHLLQAPPQRTRAGQGPESTFPHSTSQASHDWGLCTPGETTCPIKGGGFCRKVLPKRKASGFLCAITAVPDSFSLECMWQDTGGRRMQSWGLHLSRTGFFPSPQAGWASSAHGNFSASFGVTFQCSFGSPWDHPVWLLVNLEPLPGFPLSSPCTGCLCEGTAF